MNKFCIVSALLLAACGVSDEDGFTGNVGSDGGGGNGDGGNASTFADAGPPEVCSKMDILFVIDDSGSMEEEQANLVQNFPQFINVLDQFMTTDGGLLDYRLAVTTTGRDVTYRIDTSLLPIPLPFPFPIESISESGDNGVMRQQCGMTSRWVDRADGNVSSTFSCVANVGTSGPGLEMPLYATQLALGDRITDGTNAGFLREDALLAVVILTDEDDCSRTDNDFAIGTDDCGTNNPAFLPPSDTINFLDSLAGGRGRWATAVIAGESACDSSFGAAERAGNLQQFVAETGENAVFSSICDGDLSTALGEAVATFDAACRTLEPIE
tara:strand:+ start:5391 stop:6368 length:978 start_codon:yes stop_codon:yes gene_type:complete